MSEVFAVAQVARQVGGEDVSALHTYVGVVLHKIFRNKKKAEQFALKLSADASKQGEQTLVTPDGPVKVAIGEVGVHPVELVEE